MVRSVIHTYVVIYPHNHFRGKGESDGITAEVGLWASCASVGDTRKCERVTVCDLDASLTVCTKLKVARAFMTIACLLAPIAAIVFFIQVVLGSNLRKALVYIGVVLTAVTLIAGIIGVAVGGALIGEDSGAKLAAAAIIGIIALIINLVGVIIGILVSAASS